MTELSPQAQAVLNTAAKAMECPDGFLPYELELMTAALRAAADQVVPGDGSRRANEIRAEFLAIVTELENHQ